MPVVKQAWKVNTQPYDAMSAELDGFQDRAFALFEQSAAEVEGDLLADLQEYPPVPPGSTYERTFKLRDGWEMHIGQVSGSLFKFEVTNSTDYAAWVVGSLAQALVAAARFQRDFHAAHGWKLASDTVTWYFATVLNDFQTRVEDELSEIGGFTLTRRARTRLT